MTEIEGRDPTVAPVAPVPQDTLESPSPAAGEAAQHEPATETTAPAGPWPRGAVVVAAALLVVATFLGVLAARFHAELAQERDERQSVQQVASRFATAFVTYDFRNLDASLGRIKADATAKFANEYEGLFRTSVRTLITETKAQSKGTVTDVFLGPVQGDSATALTVVNVERQGAAGRVPVAGTYFQLDLVKQGGRWKVDNVTAINFAQAGAPTPPAGTAPSAPASTSTSIAK
jgi:Mce-associated membrane protein